MKKIVLIVPDHIDSAFGGSRTVTFSKVDVNNENLLKVLCDRSDYHQHYYFKDPEKIQIKSIDDI